MFSFKLIKENLGNIFHYYLRLSIHFPSRHVNPLEHAGYKINKNEIKDIIDIIFVKNHKLQWCEEMFFSANYFHVNSKLLYH